MAADAMMILMARTSLFRDVFFAGSVREKILMGASVQSGEKPNESRHGYRKVHRRIEMAQRARGRKFHTKQTDCRLEKDYDCRNKRTGTWRPRWNLRFYARGCARKKAGRFPMREREGPTKNPIQRRQRNAQQKRRHNAPAGISNSESKEKNKTWSGFHALLMKYG